MKRRRGVATLASLVVLRALGPLGGLAAQGLPDHSVFSAVLRAHVRGGRVDYAALQEDSVRLRSYLADLAATAPETIAKADGQAQLAFWINAYNACMLKQVIEHYSIERAAFRHLATGSTTARASSVRDISGVFKRQHCRVAGALRSQDDIEHGILRPMGDPRIHFAINCAARSCPALAPEAYVPEQLDQQLDAAVHRFVETDTQLRIVMGDRPALQVNKILDWYSKDFGGAEGVKQFFARYLPPNAVTYVQRADVRLRFFDYDWTLNDVDR
jgi:Protein of unknown function, DUF547